MNKNKIFSGAGWILIVLLTIGILAFLGVPYAEAAAVGPPVATLISPSGAITDTTPTYTWNKVTVSEWYYLWVNGPSGNVIKQWYRSSAVCGASTCSATPTTTLGIGNYRWWIQTWNTSGAGPWSSVMNFSVGTIPRPGAATLVSPSGAITDTTPTYTWNKVNSATWYYLWVNGPSGNVIKTWYNSSAVCSASNCSITPGVTLAGGNHQWWIQTWNSGGHGPWSSAKNFNLPASGFNSQFNSSSTGWQAHSSSWTIEGGQWYTAPGLSGLYASTSYNGTFSTLDYGARLWRKGYSDNCLVIRGSPTPLDIFRDWDSGYRFCYTQAGTYTVQKRTVDTYWTALQPWTVSSAIPVGEAWNAVRVIANGSSLYFYINGVLIWSGADSTLASGRVGITFYDASQTGGNPLRVDWATLSTVVSSTILDTISPEQQALNQAALESTIDMQVLPPGNP